MLCNITKLSRRRVPTVTCPEHPEIGTYIYTLLSYWHYRYTYQFIGYVLCHIVTDFIVLFHDVTYRLHNIIRRGLMSELFIHKLHYK